MKLMEFFGKPMSVDKKKDPHQDDQNMADDLFWFIVDHDKLHKDYFHPLAVKIHKAEKANKLNKEEIVKDFLPMVKHGCMEFYKKHKMHGRPQDHFTKEVVEDLCEKLFDHYREDIVKGVYKLGL